ncbi:hypothetical protein ACQ5SI_23925 [Peribacillus frigoritolerans]|uniref:hypothetical protein n=1 Tax=Peribacillus frigoritolerans TaxID=450367 RepID=UPI003D340C07
MDWQPIVVSILTSSIVTLTISTFVKGGIGNFYNKKLARFNSDLNLVLEEKKLDFQRKIYDFGLYSTKRHEIYPEIYKKLIKSTNSISYLISILELKKNIPNIDEKQEAFIFDLIRKAINDTEDAFDYFVDSELFLSENISDYGKEIVVSLLDTSRNITASISLKRDFDNPDINVGGKNPRQEIYVITEKTSKLMSMMRNELRIGDYEK